MMIYDINYNWFGHLGFSYSVTGTFDVDGTATSWDLIWTTSNIFATTSHESTGTDSLSPYLILGDTLVFDFGPNFTNSISVPVSFGPGCPTPGQCGTIFATTLSYTTQEFHILGTLQVPSPIAGEGLAPLLLLAVAWRKWWKKWWNERSTWYKETQYAEKCDERTYTGTVQAQKGLGQQSDKR